MSFHGGLIGAIVSMYYISIKHQIKIFTLSDLITPLIPFGLGAGRLGNLINEELYGRIAINFPYAVLFHSTYNQDAKLALQYPQLQSIIKEYGTLPRHPSQIYEFILEGVVLFLIIYLYNQKTRPTGSTSGLFLVSYGIFRIISEVFREPDPQIGLIEHYITMGQILSIPMIIFGLVMIFVSFYKKSNFEIS